MSELVLVPVLDLCKIGPCFFHQCSRTRASMHAADGWRRRDRRIRERGWPDVRPVAPLGWILRNPWNCNTCTGRVPTSRRPRRVGNWGSERETERSAGHMLASVRSPARTRDQWQGALVKTETSSICLVSCINLHAPSTHYGGAYICMPLRKAGTAPERNARTLQVRTQCRAAQEGREAALHTSVTEFSDPAPHRTKRKAGTRADLIHWSWWLPRHSYSLRIASMFSTKRIHTRWSLSVLFSRLILWCQRHCMPIRTVLWKGRGPSPIEMVSLLR
jgi:hypothetical protein